MAFDDCSDVTIKPAKPKPRQLSNGSDRTVCLPKSSGMQRDDSQETLCNGILYVKPKSDPSTGDLESRDVYANYLRPAPLAAMRKLRQVFPNPATVDTNVPERPGLLASLAQKAVGAVTDKLTDMFSSDSESEAKFEERYQRYCRLAERVASRSASEESSTSPEEEEDGEAWKAEMERGMSARIRRQQREMLERAREQEERSRSAPWYEPYVNVVNLPRESLNGQWLRFEKSERNKRAQRDVDNEINTIKYNPTLFYTAAMSLRAPRFSTSSSCTCHPKGTGYKVILPPPGSAPGTATRVVFEPSPCPDEGNYNGKGKAEAPLARDPSAAPAAAALRNVAAASTASATKSQPATMTVQRVVYDPNTSTLRHKTLVVPKPPPPPATAAAAVRAAEDKAWDDVIDARMSMRTYIHEAAEYSKIISKCRFACQLAEAVEARRARLEEKERRKALDEILEDSIRAFAQMQAYVQQAEQAEVEWRRRTERRQKRSRVAKQRLLFERASKDDLPSLLNRALIAEQMALEEENSSDESEYDSDDHQQQEFQAKQEQGLEKEEDVEEQQKEREEENEQEEPRGRSRKRRFHL